MQANLFIIFVIIIVKDLFIVLQIIVVIIIVKDLFIILQIIFVIIIVSVSNTTIIITLERYVFFSFDTVSIRYLFLFSLDTIGYRTIFWPQK